MQAVRCNKCGWIGKEEELKTDRAEGLEYCPHCNDTEALMDIDKGCSFDSQEVEKLWELFGEIPINDEDMIEEEFLGFQEGTDRFEIWHWFDEVYQDGVVKLMNGGAA